MKSDENSHLFSKPRMVNKKYGISNILSIKIIKVV